MRYNFLISVIFLRSGKQSVKPIVAVSVLATVVASDRTSNAPKLSYFPGCAFRSSPRKIERVDPRATSAAKEKARPLVTAATPCSSNNYEFTFFCTTSSSMVTLRISQIYQRCGNVLFLPVSLFSPPHLSVSLSLTSESPLGISSSAGLDAKAERRCRLTSFFEAVLAARREKVSCGF